MKSIRSFSYILLASVEGFANSSRCCGETEDVETLVASDHIERKILVEVCCTCFFLSFFAFKYYCLIRKNFSLLNDFDTVSFRYLIIYVAHRSFLSVLY